jgi:hypothetical protein
MQRMFTVCQRGRESRWTVTLGDTIYGAYLDREQALLDAVDAARAIRCKPAARPRSGLVMGRPQSRCSNRFSATHTGNFGRRLFRRALEARNQRWVTTPERSHMPPPPVRAQHVAQAM